MEEIAADPESLIKLKIRRGLPEIDHEKVSEAEGYDSKHVIRVRDNQISTSEAALACRELWRI